MLTTTGSIDAEKTTKTMSVLIHQLPGKSLVHLPLIAAMSLQIGVHRMNVMTRYMPSLKDNGSKTLVSLAALDRSNSRPIANSLRR